MLKRNVWLMAFLAIVLGTLTFIACGGDGPGAPSPVMDNPAPVASTPSTPAAPVAPAPPSQSYVATSGVCNGKVVHTTANGVMGFCVLDSNLPGFEGCLNINPDKVGDRIFVKIGIVYKGSGGGYTRTAIYHESENACKPTEQNNGADPENDRKSFKDGDTLELWRPVSPNECGLYQWDGDIRDGDPANRLDVLGFMLVYPTACRTCDAANLQVTKAQTTEGDNEKVTISATWNRNGGDKASLYEGSTFIQSIDKPGAFSVLTLPRDGKSHTYTVKLENGNLEPSGTCEQSVTVTTGEQCVPEWKELEPEITYGEWGECKKPAEASASTVTPECSQSRTVRTVIKEQNTCTQEIRVKSDKTTEEKRPCDCKYSCDDLRTSFEEASCVAAAGVTPTVKKCFSGSFSAGTASVDFGDSSPAQPVPGSPFNTSHFYEQTGSTQYFTATMNVAYQGLTCPKSAKVEIPPLEKKECKLVLEKDVNKDSAKDGDTLKYTLTVSNEGTGDCTGGGVKIEDKAPDNVDYTGTSGTVGQCVWQGPIEWNCGTVKPDTSITVWWTGKVDNPRENCNDLIIKNKAYGWSAEKGGIWSNEVTTTVDIECGSTCPPSSTTMSVNWSKLLYSTYGNNPKCSDFGLTSLYKKEWSGEGPDSWSTDRAASIVIVKDGSCTADGPEYFAKKASPQDPNKWISSGLNVSFHCGTKDKALSHVEMCGCPVGGASATSGGLFDPYLVSDPIFE